MGHRVQCTLVLPPALAAQVRAARGAAKRQWAEGGWMGAALGASVAGLAVLSVLLFRSYSANK